MLIYSYLRCVSWFFDWRTWQTLSLNPIFKFLFWRMVHGVQFLLILRTGSGGHIEWIFAMSLDKTNNDEIVSIEQKRWKVACVAIVVTSLVNNGSFSLFLFGTRSSLYNKCAQCKKQSVTMLKNNSRQSLTRWSHKELQISLWKSMHKNITINKLLTWRKNYRRWLK